MKELNKIVIATGTYPPEVSGQSTFVANFSRQLPTTLVWSVVTYGEPVAFKDNKIFAIKRDAWRYFNYFRILRRQAKGAQLIFAQDLISSGLPAVLAKRRGQKLVLRLGGDFLWEKMVNAGKVKETFSRYYSRPKSLVEEIYLLLYRLVLKRADKIIFNTEWQKKIYQERFHLPAEKLAVIANPFSARRVSERGDNFSSSEIIFAGRFIPLKNLRRLIEAFALVAGDKKLVLIGDGPQIIELKKLATQDRRVSIEAPAGREALLQRLAKAFLLVAPSLSEMNPNIAMEALSLKVPVLLTQENGLPEKIKKSCYLVDPLSLDSLKEGLEYFLTAENYQQAMSQIKKLPTTDGWPELIAKYLSIFKKL